VVIPDGGTHLARERSADRGELAALSPQQVRRISPGPVKQGQLDHQLNFTRQWRKALEEARELMDRMGHSTTRAALIYQHRTSLRDKMIADEISRRAEAERPQSGTRR
jgi:hypothetical protein